MQTESEQRELAMKTIMSMGIVEFIEALKGIRGKLPDFVRENLENFESIPIRRQVALNWDSVGLAYYERHELRYHTPKEFLSIYPARQPLFKKEYENNDPLKNV